VPGTNITTARPGKARRARDAHWHYSLLRMTTNKIANIENEICSVETMSRHPELFHYTKPTAFESIIKSQTLWCSHYRTVLDQYEVRLMRALLPPAVAPRMDAIIEKLNRRTRRLWDASGRGAQTARDLVDSLYGATVDGKAEYSALDPYLFSFSTHSEDTAFGRRKATVWSLTSAN
jgi:hypothetical protein